MFNNNPNNISKSDRYPMWNFEIPEFQPHELPIDPSFGFINSFPMPFYGQFIQTPQLQQFNPFPPVYEQPQIVKKEDPPVRIQHVDSQRSKPKPTSTRTNQRQQQRFQRGNLKNTYINKIQDLMKDKPIEIDNIDAPQTIQQSIQNQSKAIVKPKLSTGQQSNNTKLQRNRECARNSRKRKKMYIELLEKKMRVIESEIHDAKAQAQRKLDGCPNQWDFQFSIDESNPSAKEHELEQFTDVNNTQTDQQRMKLMKFMVVQMLNTNFPNHLKFLFAACSQKTEDVDEMINKWMDTLSADLMLSPQQITRLMATIQGFKNKTEKLEEIMTNMKQIVTELDQEYLVIQEIISTQVKDLIGNEALDEMISQAKMIVTHWDIKRMRPATIN